MLFCCRCFIRFNVVATWCTNTSTIAYRWLVHNNKVPIRKCKVGEKRINKFLEHRYYDKLEYLRTWIFTARFASAFHAISWQACQNVVYFLVHPVCTVASLGPTSKPINRFVLLAVIKSMFEIQRMHNWILEWTSGLLLGLRALNNYIFILLRSRPLDERESPEIEYGQVGTALGWFEI